MISTQEVQRIAHLSKLNLEGDELEKLAKDFNQILEFVKQINTADVSGVEPFDHVLGVVNSQREDIPGAGLNSTDIKAYAPRYEAGYIVVPKVIETEG